MIPKHTRRAFLKTTAAASAAVWAGPAIVTGAAGANERIVLGMIGCGGRGGQLLGAFGGANLAYVCDPDEARLASFKKNNTTLAAKTATDMRRVLDDKSVDAVIVATPDHWHAPAAILACEAGKHVYVEKPQSHNLRESRLLVEAARRNKVVVQHGTQQRSSSLVAGGIQMLREGLIGNVLVARAWNVQIRGNIGHQQPGDPPAGLDYDLWVGPAEMVPFQKNRFHYDWHWWYNFGTGDIGNDGAHDIDYARWGLGVEGLPATATAIGGKYFFDDDQEFPDTATCAFEWPGEGKVGKRRQLIFELRLWDGSYPYNCDSGAEFHGTSGRMVLSKRGKLLVYRGSKLLEGAKPKEPPQVESHHGEFLSAIRQGRKPNADVAIGHDSVALIHLANVAVRLGRSLKIDPKTEQIVGDEQANELLGRRYRKEGHWAIPKDAHHQP